MPYVTVPPEPARGQSWPDMASAIVANLSQATSDIPMLVGRQSIETIPIDPTPEQIAAMPEGAYYFISEA